MRIDTIESPPIASQQFEELHGDVQSLAFLQ